MSVGRREAAARFPARSAKAAGDGERFPGDPVRVAGGEEDHGRRDVSRRADSAERSLGLDLLPRALGRRAFVVPIPGTRQSRWREENLDAAGMSPAADRLAALDHIVAPGAVAGARDSDAEKRRVEL